jgi:uncharacterized repeat protein (TIGR01451 family)
MFLNLCEEKGMKYIFVWLLLLPSLALAAPDVQVAITAEKIVVLEEGGKHIEKRVPATDVLPGDVIVYTLQYENKGDEAAQNVVLNDPIPQGTSYVVDCAFSPAAEVSFSIDGKSFKNPSLLTYMVKKNGKTEQRKASPEQYTHIRWVVKKIPAGKSGVVGFRVKVN